MASPQGRQIHDFRQQLPEGKTHPLLSVMHGAAAGLGRRKVDTRALALSGPRRAIVSGVTTW